MQRSEPVQVKPASFVIEVDQLKIKSRKPRHLESRMQGAKKQHSLEHHRVVHQSRAHRRAAFLEERRQACAEKVEKAKMVALNHSKKVEDQRQALKDMHDHKMIASDQRRQKMINTPRAKILDKSQEIVDPNSIAASLIQTWWRVLKVGKVTRLYKKMGLSLESSKKMSFEKLAKLSQSEPMAKAVGRMLVRAKRTSVYPVENWKNPTRVFLSAYMVVAHPEAVFEHLGPTEENLQECALQMLTDFEAWMDYHNTSKVLMRGRRFLESWINYYNAFESWKSGNAEQLALDLMKHFMELEKLWIAVRNQEDAELEWMSNVSRQQKQVFTRLQRLNEKFMKDLLEKRELARQEFLDNEENDLSSVKAITMINTSVDVYPVLTKSRRDSVSKPAPGSEDIDKSEVESKLHKEAGDISSIWSNQKLAHELVIDPDFKMKRSDVNSLEGQVADVAKKVFFESVKAQFDSGDFKCASSLIGDIREMLINMVPEKSKLRLELSEALDTDLIEQQIEKNVFDVKGCLDYVTSKMLQLCAPVRDSAIKAIQTETDLVIIFQKILDVLEDMKLDLMNYQLQSIKPLVKHQAVEYEQKKFAESLEKNEITLAKTTTWLEKYAELLKESSFSRNPENIDHPDLKVSYEKVYHDAFLGLLFSTSRLELSEIPETFYLDIERLLFMQNEAQALTIVASVTMLLKNIVPALRSNSKAMMEIKKDLLSLLEAPDTSFENIALHLIEKSKTVTTITPDQETMIRNMVEKTVSFNDGIFSLISRRMQTIIRHQMEKSTFKQESLASYGLDTIASELENLSRRIYLLVKHNKEVYVNHYDSILNLFI